MWIAVRSRFRTFHLNLTLTDAQIGEGQAHHIGVRRCLNSHYYGLSSDYRNSFLIGSWGKFTKTRPPRDIDLYFEMPIEVYHRYETVSNNKQSALLQEVKNVLNRTYTTTDKIKGDGQVVVVGFNRMSVEVVPAFLMENGKYLICNTHDGGRYVVADPKEELSYISDVNDLCNANLRPLIMMFKAWQENCNVPLKSFWIELILAEFMMNYEYREYDYYWFDWFIRDIFTYLVNKANQQVLVPGTYEQINLGNNWLNKAMRAQSHSILACKHEYNDNVRTAGEIWQKIFGSQIPLTV